MRIFKTRWLVRFARREGISDASLMEAVARAERGLIDAGLGSGLIRQRVARDGKGRSGGYRMLVVYKRGTRAVYVFGFAKKRAGQHVTRPTLRFARGGHAMVGGRRNRDCEWHFGRRVEGNLICAKSRKAR
jgi:hypothetical protein